jgi:phosphonate transport system ATP-binding protein
LALLIHGFGASVGHWRHNQPVLAQQVEVFALDLLGFGASDKPRSRLADEPLASLDPRLAEELLALLLDYTRAPRALVMSLHRPDLLGGFDRVVGLRAGRVLFDQPVDQLGQDQLTALYASSL